ncbi:hypothetical protein ABBQ38_009688 [Trebouxia sp. C0009 RCD-2024]
MHSQLQFPAVLLLRQMLYKGSNHLAESTTAAEEVQASEAEDADLQEAIARSLRQEQPGGSSALEEEASDIEWMDLEPGPSGPVPPGDSSARAASSGALALKPPLPPGPSRQPSARPPSYPSRGQPQQKPEMADFRLQHASTIGRHQAAADALLHGDTQIQEPPLGRLPSQDGNVPSSPKQHQGLESPPEQRHASMLSPTGKPDPQQASPAESPDFPSKQPSRPVSPITSPFKKVPSPWEKGQMAASKGNSQGTVHQISLPSAPQPGKSPLLGKRKARGNPSPGHTQGEIKQLQHIIARADDIARNHTQDSVLLDVLAGVPDDQAMPLSIEDRGTGLEDTAADNLKGSSAGSPSAAPPAAMGGLGRSGMAPAHGKLVTMGQVHSRHNMGRLDSAQEAGEDTTTVAAQRVDSEHVVDMTVDADSAAPSQPVSFDDIDEEFDADLIAAVDKSAAEHASGSLQHNDHRGDGHQAADRTAAAAAASAPCRDIADESPAGSQAADTVQQQQQEQEQQQQQQQQQQRQQQQQQQEQQERQQQQSRARQGIDASTGLSDSLPAPSEVGLGEYGSAALEGGPSMGVSSTLPSFDLDAEMDSLDEQSKRLKSQHRAQVRNADSPTGEMYGECQELLQMFGLPYIIAPMEAEAQCAWLDEAKLVDGVVTDDNDVFLFGGQHVYRNIFEGKKYVEEYRVQDVESELGMTRDKLIQLALLLGSDYTEGVAGIGIVNAVEIVNAFPTEELLVNFRKWALTPDAQLITALGGAADVDLDQHIRAFKHTHAGLRKNWDVPETFPNTAVIKAYRDAKVDQNKDKFTYGRPDLQLLRRFCQDKFGWQQDRADELLLPVLKAYDDNQTQMTLDGFLSFSQRFAKIKSRRLQKAVAGITGVANPEMTFADMSEDPVPKRRKQSKARTAGKAAEEKKDVEAAAASTAGASRSGTAAGLEEAASEPAELTRTGAAEVAADADVSLVSPQG